MANITFHILFYFPIYNYYIIDYNIKLLCQKFHNSTGKFYFTDMYHVIYKKNFGNNHCKIYL